MHIIPTLGLALSDFRGCRRSSGHRSSARRRARLGPQDRQRAVGGSSSPSTTGVRPTRTRLKLPKQIKKRKKFLTHEQVAALAEAVDAKPAGEGFGLLDPGARVHRAAVGRAVRTARARPRLRSRTPRRAHHDDRGQRHMQESTPKDYEERSIPVPAFILEQLADPRRGQGRSDARVRQLEGGAVLRNRDVPPRMVRRRGREHRHPGSDSARAAAHVRESRGVGRSERQSAPADARAQLGEGDPRHLQRPVRRGPGQRRRRSQRHWRFAECGQNVGKATRSGSRGSASSKKSTSDRPFSRSPLSDSNRRPPLYKSGALAN